MNVISAILIPLVILLFCHLVVLPLINRRPVIIKDLEGTLFVYFLIQTFFGQFSNSVYIFSLFISIFFYVSKSWIVIGVPLDYIYIALNKAVIATKSISENIPHGYRINDSMSVKIYGLGKKAAHITLKNIKSSKKTVLTKEIFRKYLQNYLINGM